VLSHSNLFAAIYGLEYCQSLISIIRIRVKKRRDWVWHRLSLM